MSDSDHGILYEGAVCENCGREFSAAICMHPFEPTQIFCRQRNCESCCGRYNEQKAAESLQRTRESQDRKRTGTWTAMCPLEFRSTEEGGYTNVARLEREQPGWLEIKSHPLGRQGILIRGESGSCKTRAMWRLMSGFFWSDSRPTVVAISSGEFDRQARDAGGNFTLSAWFERMAGANALFVDDVGKAPWSAGTIGQFFEVIDARYKRGLPVFLTTNSRRDVLAAQLNLGADLADPLFRRLEETCRMILFMRPDP